jgi:glycosyltransferase involved in cell wall biosynthesis
MACGLPVLVSDRAGVTEIIEREGGGEILPVTGPSPDGRWTERTRLLLADPELRDQMGTKAREVAANHPFADFIARFEQLLLGWRAERGTRAAS